MENTIVIADFKQDSPCLPEVYDTYRNRLPKEILDVWENYGFGSFDNGFLRVINPKDYEYVLQQSYYRADNAIPMMVTAFGDLIVWQEDTSHFYILRFRHGTFHVMGGNMKLFFRNLEEKGYRKRFFQMNCMRRLFRSMGNLPRMNVSDSSRF